MTHEELVNGVLAKLNEIGYSDDVSLITENNTQLTDYIEVAIRDAVVNLDRVNTKEKSVPADGVVVLDEDFVSLVEATGDSWNRAVSVITEKGTAAYNMAMNEYTAPKANSPMVVREGVRKLMFLPNTNGTMVYNAAYGGAGIAGESEARLVIDAAAQIVYNIFKQ